MSHRLDSNVIGRIGTTNDDGVVVVVEEYDDDDVLAISLQISVISALNRN